VARIMESASVLKGKIDAMIRASQAKDVTIASLQQRLASAMEAWKLDKTTLAEATSRSLHLQKEVQQGLDREGGLQQQLMELQIQHQRDLAEMELRHEREIERLLSSQQVLEEAEERLCAQLGDLEAETLEQNRFFNSQFSSLSSSLAAREMELASARSELESLRQKRQSLKELETMDLAGQLSKSRHDCDAMATRLHDATHELEKVKLQAENLQRDLALSENRKRLSLARDVEKESSRSRGLCRADSLNWHESQLGSLTGAVPV
jgi:chromosome segregation ATPase